MTREQIQAEIDNLKAQHANAIETAHQASGAIQSLQWVLNHMGGEEPSMTVDQLNDAIARGAAPDA